MQVPRSQAYVVVASLVKCTSSFVVSPSAVQQRHVPQRSVRLQQQLRRYYYDAVSLDLPPAELTTEAKSRLARWRALPTHVNSWDDDPIIGPQPPMLEGRKTLVLDLDETMGTGYCDSENGFPKEGRRPHYAAFLKCALNNFEVVVWTRSPSPYAEDKCKTLGLYDRLCHPVITGWGDCDGSGAKDLVRLGRPMDQVILLDDNGCNTSIQPRCHAKIPEFMGEQYDVELKKAIPFLEAVANADTVQDVLDPFFATYLGDDVLDQLEDDDDDDDEW